MGRAFQAAATADTYFVVARRIAPSATSYSAVRAPIAALASLLSCGSVGCYLITDFEGIDDADIQCEGEDVVLDGATKHCYKLFSSPTLTWPAAESSCMGWGEGHLVSISGAEEQGIVYDLLRPTGDGAWIGLTDATSEGTFVWSTGEQLTFKNWATDEPDGMTAEKDCVFEGPPMKFNWDDYRCDIAHAYICERHPGAP